MSQYNQLPDDTPVPLLIAKEWNFPLDVVTNQEGILMYSVRDWLRGITLQRQALNLWKHLKIRYPELEMQYQMFPRTEAYMQICSPYLREQDLIELLSKIQVLGDHHESRVVTIQNYIATQYPQYNHIFRVKIDVKFKNEGSFRSELARILKSFERYRVYENYQLPSGKIIDIALLSETKENSDDIALIIECKLFDKDFSKAIGQLMCYASEIRSSFHSISSNRLIVALPVERCTSYILKIIHQLDMGLWTLLNGQIVDGITREPIDLAKL